MTTRDKIERKIEALMSKTVDNGATESEMMAAMEKAAELMAKYGIKKLREKGTRVGYGKWIKGPFAKADFWMACAVARVLVCRVGGQGKNSLGRFIFVGEESAVSACESMFAKIRLQATQLARMHISAGVTTDKGRRSFVAEYRKGLAIRLLHRAEQWIRDAEKGAHAPTTGEPFNKENALVVQSFVKSASDALSEFLEEEIANGAKIEEQNEDMEKLTKFPKKTTLAGLLGYRDGDKVVMREGTGIAK